MENTILLMFHMTHQTRLFNRGQKVWIVRLTGNQAAQVKGRYRGKGRYISGWVTWDKNGKPFPEIKEIPVNPEFYGKIRGGAVSDEGYG